MKLEKSSSDEPNLCGATSVKSADMGNDIIDEYQFDDNFGGTSH